MAKIVGVHGINQEFRGSNLIYHEWLPALKDGLQRAGATLKSDDDFRCAFYGHLFRGGQKSVTAIPNYDVNDLDSDWEKELLQQWWAEVAQIETEIKGPTDLGKEKATPRFLQRALSALSCSRYFGGAAENVVIFLLKQVGGYLHDPTLRTSIRQQVIEAIDTFESLTSVESDIEKVTNLLVGNFGYQPILTDCQLNFDKDKLIKEFAQWLQDKDRKATDCVIFYYSGQLSPAPL